MYAIPIIHYHDIIPICYDRIVDIIELNSYRIHLKRRGWAIHAPKHTFKQCYVQR